MLWVVAFCLTLACYAVSGQPVSCSTKDQCGEGYYCEISTHRCLECLKCIDLKRQPPTNPAHSSCVMSLVDCGPCMEGFVVDHSGDVNSQCISRDTRQDSLVMPPFVWALIAIGIVIIVGVLVYLYRSLGSIKVWVSTPSRTLFDRPSEVRSGEDLPPPYNPNFNHVANANPSYAPPPDWTQQPHEETSQPFIKQAPSAERQDARESSGHQAARVYYPPSYEDQEHDALSSPEATEEELSEDVHNNNVHRRDKNGPSSWMPEDEDTVASTWRPYEADTNTSAGANTNDNTNANANANSNANPNNNTSTAGNDDHDGWLSRRRAAGGERADDAAPGPSAAKRTCLALQPAATHLMDTSTRICDSGTGAGDSSGAGNQPLSTSHNQIVTVNIANYFQ